MRKIGCPWQYEVFATCEKLLKTVIASYINQLFKKFSEIIFKIERNNGVIVISIIRGLNRKTKGIPKDGRQGTIFMKKIMLC